MRRLVLAALCGALAAGCSALYGFDYTVADGAVEARDGGDLDGGEDRSDAGPDGGGVLCPDGQTDCGGTCRDLSSDPEACGACGNACAPDATCMAGACAAIVEVEGGIDHTCARTDTGVVLCWGSNRYHQLGAEGPDRTYAAPVAFPVDEVAVDLCVGENHACAVLEDESLWCWGDNDRGQLGIGDLFPTMPWQVGTITGAVQVACGNRHTCVRKGNHEVFCFGANTTGQLGNGTALPSSDPVAVADLDGSLPVLDLQAGRSHTCAIVQPSGMGPELRCWGNGADGRLGAGGTGSSFTPVRAALLPGPPIELAVGGAHTCAVVDVGAGAGGGGALYCWGDGGSGQVGDGGRAAVDPTQIDGFPPVSAGVEDIVRVVAGEQHTCATRQGGALFCWGSNRSGQLALTALRADPASPTRAGDLNVTVLGVGHHHTCAVVDGALHCWGWDAAGGLGIGAALYQPTPVEVPGLTGVASVAVAFGYTCAVDGDGALSCFGENGNGQLGDGTFTTTSSPVSVDVGRPVTAVRLANRHACAIAGPQLACWGANQFGQLGQGDIVGRPEPEPVPFATDRTLVDAAVGQDFTCALVTRDGPELGLDCWGANDSGQLGRGSSGGSVSSPGAFVTLTGTGTVGTVTAGEEFGCAERGGTVSCWGETDDGRIGTGGTGLQLTPVTNGASAQRLRSGDRTSCAWNPTSFDCWGWNPDGALGGDVDTTVPTARPGTPLPDAEFSVGRRHLCVIDGAGAVHCAGRNEYGELGDGTFASRPDFAPVTLPGPATALAAGSEHTCAVVGDGRLFCWGHDLSGRLGLERTIRVTTPTPVLFAEPGAD